MSAVPTSVPKSGVTKEFKAFLDFVYSLKLPISTRSKIATLGTAAVNAEIDRCIEAHGGGAK